MIPLRGTFWSPKVRPNWSLQAASSLGSLGGPKNGARKRLSNRVWKAGSPTAGLRYFRLFFDGPNRTQFGPRFQKIVVKTASALSWTALQSHNQAHEVCKFLASFGAHRQQLRASRALFCIIFLRLKLREGALWPDLCGGSQFCKHCAILLEILEILFGVFWLRLSNSEATFGRS